MLRFNYSPMVEQEAPDPRDRGFFQRIELLDERSLVGQALWHLPLHADGVLQIIELTIVPSQRRHGHGRRLLDEVLLQARRLAASRGIRLRRAWLMIEQKSQLPARAFLTRHGFHHTSTASNLLLDQDLLLYSKSFD